MLLEWLNSFQPPKCYKFIANATWHDVSGEVCELAAGCRSREFEPDDVTNRMVS